MKRYLSLIFVLGLSIISAQNCSQPTSYEYLHINNVKALLGGAGGLWFNGDDKAEYYIPYYEIPNPLNQTNLSMLFSGGLFLSGIGENSNQIHNAGCFYQTGYGDFWAGPINQSGEFISTEECGLWNRHFKINKSTIDSFKLNLFPAGQIPTIINEWPAKGNAYLQNQGFTLTNDYAPFYDTNGNGQYDPQNGDYPLIKGDQAVYWVFNDNQGQFHYDFNGTQIGVEIQVMAYAYATNDILNDVTFYDYKITNKHSQNYRDFYVSFYFDPDIGNAFVNRLGVDTLNDYVFSYYGDNPFFCFGNLQYSNLTTAVLCESNSLKMSSYSSLSVNEFSSDSLINLQRRINNYSDSIFPKFQYPGNPINCSFPSSEVCDSIPYGDRMYTMDYGPYDFNSLSELNFTIMILSTERQNYNINQFDTEIEFEPFYQAAKQKYFEKETSCGFKETITGIKNHSIKSVEIYPNPCRGNFHIKQFNNDLCYYTVSDVLGNIVLSGSFNTSFKDVQITSKGLYFIHLNWPHKGLSANERLIVD